MFYPLCKLRKVVSGDESDNQKGGAYARGAMCKALMGDDALAPIFPDTHPAERRRFLAARDGNLEEAVEMLRSHLSWRSAHELAMANTEDPPPLIGSKLCAIRLNPPLPPATTRHA